MLEQKTLAIKERIENLKNRCMSWIEDEGLIDDMDDQQIDILKEMFELLSETESLMIESARVQDKMSNQLDFLVRISQK